MRKQNKGNNEKYRAKGKEKQKLRAKKNKITKQKGRTMHDPTGSVNSSFEIGSQVGSPPLYGFNRWPFTLNLSPFFKLSISMAPCTNTCTTL